MLIRKASAIALSILLLCIGSTRAEQAPGQAAIASAHPLATRAGHEILAAGGNAFDAAVAVASTLAVVEPYASGVGGGAFFLLHRAKDNYDVMLDARETAPLAATRDMFLNKEGEAIESFSRDGALAAAIPGWPLALEVLAKEYGRKSLKDSMAASIQHARQGFATGERYSKMVGWREEILKRNPAATSIFLQNGTAPAPGFKLIQKDLANTLELIANKGAIAFYRGGLAERMVNEVNSTGGIWSKKDLANYRILQRKPIKAKYKDMQITVASLPSSGGIVLVDSLNMLGNFDLTAAGEVDRIHLVTEVLRRAYRDRAEFLGDSDFVFVPVKQLLHPYYAAGQAAGIRLDKATPSDMFAGVPETAIGADTTHFSIIDKEGNRVSATLSINFPFGSGFVVADTGIVLNNEMDDFAAKAGVPNGYGLIAGRDNPNAVFPGKRMLSSMTPTFLETDNRLAVLGTPGGSRIISMVLLATLDFYNGADANTIVSKPRFHHQFLPDQIIYEKDAFNQDTKLELQLRGHRLAESSRHYGNMQVVIWDKRKNALSAASDPRGEGLAVVLDPAIKSRDDEPRSSK
ncbi:MAG: gamma-glutamyltransferase [Gammaproteobacteria bacterium]|nr:gamma-glutamyltransferase [Gammaproteobacteria bacterium]